MNEHQYERLLTNRRRRPLQPLFAVGAGDRALRDLAKQYRRRERAARALEHVVPAAWLAATRVEAVDGDLVVLRVRDSAIAEQLRRTARQLGRDLGARIPGVTRVIALPEDYGDGDRAEGEPQ